jgi:uncharacterized protein (TIGR03067 family)
MKSTLLYFLVALFALPSLCRASEQDKAALQGKWRAIEATSNGEPPPNGMLERLTLVFSGDTVSIMGAPPTGFRLDATAKPAHIDFLNSHNQVGIYILEGDTLKLCTGENGDRPSVFSTKKFTDHTYMLLKRVKE